MTVTASDMQNLIVNCFQNNRQRRSIGPLTVAQSRREQTAPLPICQIGDTCPRHFRHPFAFLLESATQELITYHPHYMQQRCC